LNFREKLVRGVVILILSAVILFDRLFFGTEHDTGLVLYTFRRLATKEGGE